MHPLLGALRARAAEEQGALPGCPRLQPLPPCLSLSYTQPPTPRPRTLPSPPPAPNSLGALPAHSFPASTQGDLLVPTSPAKREPVSGRAPSPAEPPGPALCWAGADEALGLKTFRDALSCDPQPHGGAGSLSSLVRGTRYQSAGSVASSCLAPRRSLRPRDAGVLGEARAQRSVRELERPHKLLSSPF